MLKVILSFIVMCGVLSVSSQGFAEESCQYRNTVGFTAGVTTGLGLTYRGSCDDWFGQVAFMPAWTRDGGGNFFAGTQLGRVVQGTDSFYLNVALGLGFMLTEGEQCTYDPELPMPLCGKVRDTFLAVGPSVGLGKVWGEHFQTELYLPIAAVWEFGEGLHSVVPYPGITLGYIW